MFGLLRRFWKGGLATNDALAWLRFERWPEPRNDALRAKLPDRYVAVRFYFSVSFPDNAENRAVVRTAVGTLAERTPVVLLNTGLQLDDHLEVEEQDDTRVLRPLAGVPPEENLGAQSFVVSQADAFVGTLGGPAWYPPAYGVPSIGLVSSIQNIFPTFIDVARRSTADYGAPLIMVETEQVPNLALLAGERARLVAQGASA
jgi:hypothetical protein